MRVALAAVFPLLGCVPLIAQAPPPAAGQSVALAQIAAPAAAATQPARVDDSDVGFIYSLPSDWEFVAPPPAPKITVPFPDAMGAKKGDACVEVVLTATHGTPESVVVVTALPFACYGQPLKPGDLANFGAGAAEGLKQTFDVTDPCLLYTSQSGLPRGRGPFSFSFALPFRGLSMVHTKARRN